MVKKNEKRCINCMKLYEAQYDVCPHCGYQEGQEERVLLHMEPGTVLKNRYTIGRALGYGSFGVTYIAWDNLLETRIAIKEYLPSEFATRMVDEQEILISTGDKVRQQYSKGLHRFVEEGKKLAKVSNIDGIVHMHDSFEANNTAYITMEYLEGETLATYMDREKKLTEPQAMELMLPILEALEQVHQKGIIHRDISPDNIFLAIDEKGHVQVKLIDFGAAKFSTTSHSKSLTVLIKPGYSPEEQYRSDGEQGAYTDVYAIAAVMYHMVTGIRPPDALERRTYIMTKKRDPLELPSKYNSQLSQNFETALMNALNVRIEDRTSTIDEFTSELVSFEPVKRRGSTIRRIDFLRWPLWAKITVPLASAAAVALLVFVGTRIFTTSTETYALPEGMTRVPEFITESYTDAETWAADRELLIQRSGTEFVPNVAGNIVLSQDVAGGSVVYKNTMVSVNVSSEAETYTMPDVTGMKVEEAEAALECMDLNISSVRIPTDELPGLASDCVVAQDIKPYSEIKSGDSVTLEITVSSSGTGKIVPDFIGLTYEEALAEASEKGAVISISEKRFSKDNKNTEVLEQSVAPGKKLTEGQTIEVTIALSWHEFPMPNLMFSEKEKATHILNNMGIEPLIDEETSEIVAINHVADQSAAADSVVEPDEKMSLIISKGGKPVEVPSLLDMDEEEARALLAEHSLSFTPQYDFDENVEIGHIISQDPKGGEKIPRGSPVTIVICSDAELIKVSDVVGKESDEAQKILESQGLKVQLEENFSDNIKAGTVISQLPAAGSSQKEGTTIVVTVSKGAESTPAPTPDPTHTPLPGPGNDNQSSQTTGTNPTQAPTARPTPTPKPQPILSDWVDESNLPAGVTIVGSPRTLYRYRYNERETIESDSSQLSGWKQTGSEERYISDWSAWSDTEYYASNTREVQSQQVKDKDGYTRYRYGRWYNASRGKDNWCKEYSESKGGSASLEYSPYYDYILPTSGTDWTCAWKPAGGHTHYGIDHTSGDGRPWWKEYIDPNGGSWYWYESEWVPETYKTQYSYRDKKVVYFYERYVRIDNWSNWSETPAYADGDRMDVETKRQFRYEYYPN